MASANQWESTFISHKMKFLRDQEDQLNSAVGLYVDGIIAAGESWTERGDNQMEYLELLQMIDNAVVFVCEKCKELSERSVDIAAKSRQRPSCEQPDTTSQSATVLDSRQTAQPMASTTTTLNRQSTELFQSADEIHMKPVLAKISVIEETLRSFRSSAEKVAEQQSGIDKQLQDLLSKLSESDKQTKSRFRKVKEQIREINESQVALDQEQETRLQNLEKQLRMLCTTQDRMKAEMESQAELTEKLVHVPDELAYVKENLDVLDANIGRNMDDCSNAHQGIENVMRDLANKVMANIEAVQVISVDQDQKTTLLRELETRMQTLEADSGRNVKDAQKQAKKAQVNFLILCQMLNDRLAPLEQLRSCLNERTIVRDENIRQLTQVIHEVAVMSPRLQQLELKSSRSRCGFSALAWLSPQSARDTIRPYQRVYSNVGQNFNADSGIFTAPVDGLYVASISLYLKENEEVEVDVRYKKQGLFYLEFTIVCETKTTVKCTQACSVGVVDMKAGDTLFSYTHRDNTTDSKKHVYLSCFLL